MGVVGRNSQGVKGEVRHIRIIVSVINCITEAARIRWEEGKQRKSVKWDLYLWTQRDFVWRCVNCQLLCLAAGRKMEDALSS